MKSRIITNGNICLVPLEPSHKDRFVELANIPVINKAVAKPFPYTDDKFEEQLTKANSQDELYIWMIENDGSLVGVINTADHRKIGIYQGGYWIDPAFWGKGLASSALFMVRDFLITEKNAQRVQAVVEPSNAASIKVLEKCGYQNEGLLRRFYPSLDRGLIDVHMYAYLAE